MHFIDAFHTQLETWREVGDVVRLSDDSETWIVLNRQLAIEVLRDAETFTVDDPRFSTGRVLGPNMLSLDGAPHRRHRDPFTEAFKLGAPNTTSRSEMESLLRDTAKEMVNAAGATTTADLRSLVAAPLAATVMTQVLGLQGVTTSRLLSWYTAIVDSVTVTTLGQEPHQAGAEAMDALHDAVMGAVSGSTDRSPLLTAASRHLTPHEVSANAAVLLFGGLETAEAMIAIACAHVLSDSDVHHALLADRSLIPIAVEESVRLEPAAAQLDRYTTRPVRLGGQELSAGAAVQISITAANRDPQFFDRPSEFVLGRSNAHQHLSFAQGSHACLATHLAKAETVAALNAVLDLPNVRLIEPVAIGGQVFRKPHSVLVSWNSVGSLQTGAHE